MTHTKVYFSLLSFKQIFDPRDEKLNEMERIIASYQDKLDSVTSNYQVFWIFFLKLTRLETML